MNTKKRRAHVFLCLLALACPAAADDITLNDGTTLVGKVIHEDPTSYVIEVQVTKSIKDERTIAKADVKSIKREKPDGPAFEVIAKLTPTPDALTEVDYQQRIRAVEKFMADFPTSGKVRDARSILSTLKSEANEILAGAVKVDGKIIPPAEYRANAYEIDSRIEASKIKQLISKGAYIEALRAFTTFDTDFRNTAAHNELSGLITSVIRTYVARIKQSLQTFDERIRQREIGLERMTAADRQNTANAIAQENAAIEKRFEAEKAAGIGWVSTQPYFKPSLEETVTFAQQELDRLAADSGGSEMDGGKAYRDALSAIQSSADSSAINAAISDAKTAGIPERYIEVLESAAKASGYNP